MIDYKKYTDRELNLWEKEIFGQNLSNGKTFKDYLIEKGAWVVNAKYKFGAVRDKNKYAMLNEKWSCLQFLRNRRSKAQKHQEESLEQLKLKTIDVSKIPF